MFNNAGIVGQAFPPSNSIAEFDLDEFDRVIWIDQHSRHGDGNKVCSLSDGLGGVGLHCLHIYHKWDDNFI